MAWNAVPVVCFVPRTTAVRDVRWLLTVLQVAVSLAGDCYLPLCRKAELLLSVGSAREAAVLFRRARALFPSAPAEYGAVVVEARDRDAAAAQASVSRQLPTLESACPPPDIAELTSCWNNGGVAMLMSGDPQGGVAMLRDALLSSPDHVVARKVGAGVVQ